MKRLIFIVLTLIIPILFFVNVWQGFRYERMKREVGLFESEQRDWLEKNKKLIAALAVFRSPGRIEKIAESRTLPSVGKNLFVNRLEKTRRTS